MKILRDIFTKYSMKLLQVLLFSVITTCSLIPISFPGSGNSCNAFAQEPTQPGNLQKFYRNKLTKKQQQKIIEKNFRIRKLQEGIIDHKIKILGSRMKERTIIGELEKIEKELQVQKNMLATLRTKSEKQELLLSDKQEYLRQVLAEKKGASGACQIQAGSLLPYGVSRANECSVFFRITTGTP